MIDVRLDELKDPAIDAHLAEARQRGYTRLRLETGAMEAFAPAQKLYAKFGFDYCEPFADYVLDPCSVFMTRSLEVRAHKL